MKTILLNDELELTCPESFRVLSHEERNQLSFIEEGPGECLKDDSRHIMISIGWKRIGGLVSLLASTKDISVQSEKAVSQALSAYN